NLNLTICKYTSTGYFLGGQADCYNSIPVFAWIQCCFITIFRLAKSCSLSPLFEVFSMQICIHSILNNLTSSGACYIATGCGFTTLRIYFSILFSCFAGP
ncbi:hypothetical protein CPB84DRAFT_1627332, partial [Gymnopilus junonius]